MYDRGMPSVARQRWRTTSAAALDQLVAAHRTVRNSHAGPRATQELNHAYAVLLAAQFQLYCRDLHSECTRHLALAVPALGALLMKSLTYNRQLDRGNANPSSLGNDFGRFGFDFWTALRARDTRNAHRNIRLEALNAWRNAIAHQDFPISLTPSPPLKLTHVQHWRSACNALAGSMDAVMAHQLLTLGANRPW